MPKVTVKPVPIITLEDTYPEVTVQICKGDDAITAEVARQLLGWESESKTVKFGEDFLFYDENHLKCRCSNNTRNRPLNDEWCRTLAQDILNKKWKFNCETIIISRTGQILSGQHRLIAIALAVQMWEKAKEGSQWRKLWPEEPVLESLVAFGAEETDDYIQTLDNVRARTLADTLFTSLLFKTWKPRDKKNVVKVADYCVRFLWDRTGMAASETSSKLTNSEAYEFLNRHLRILDMVKHVYTENLSGGSIKSSIPLGYAAGIGYLIGASEDTKADYHQKNPPEESTLKFSKWEAALKFWISFSISKKMFGEVKQVMASLHEDGTRMTVPERVGIVIKAWQAMLDNLPLTTDAVSLSYDVAENGTQTLAEFPTLGGIDVHGSVVEEETEDEV